VHPDKAVGWNEMTSGRDTYVVTSNTVLDRDPDQGRPKAPPTTQNASQKSSGAKIRKFGGGDKV